jgi:two-component system chemotaxis response regulator CheB
VIKVVVVDDSPTERHHLERVLTADPMVQVIGSAPDPFVARDLIVQRKPDLITLDVEMPRMDGLTFLRRLMHYHPMPVVILSSLTARGGRKALEAIRAGAVAVISKPSAEYPREQMEQDLLAAVKSAGRARLVQRVAALAGPTLAKRRVAGVAAARAIAIGASTGGTVAIEQVLEAMPADGPAVVIVQHMPALFTESFAARLDRLSPMEVREARDGDRLERGLALVAPGGKHMLVRRGSMGLAVQVKDGPAVNGHRPSVDVLFRSVASVLHHQAVGALLTGMGADGARGLLQMREEGAFTIAQDEGTSVVFGMPKAAIDLGAATRVLPLESIAQALLAAAERP